MKSYSEIEDAEYLFKSKEWTGNLVYFFNFKSLELPNSQFVGCMYLKIILVRTEFQIINKEDY